MDWSKAMLTTTKFQEIKRELNSSRPRDTSMQATEWDVYQCKQAINRICDLLDEMARDNVCESNYVEQ